MKSKFPIVLKGHFRGVIIVDNFNKEELDILHFTCDSMPLEILTEEDIKIRFPGIIEEILEQQKAYDSAALDYVDIVFEQKEEYKEEAVPKKVIQEQVPVIVP